MSVTQFEYLETNYVFYNPHKNSEDHKPDGDGDGGILLRVHHGDVGLVQDEVEPVVGGHPLAGRLVHDVTELHAADEDPGGGRPALQLTPELEHDPVLGARGGEQEVRERGVETGVNQRGELSVITIQRKILKDFVFELLRKLCIMQIMACNFLFNNSIQLLFTLKWSRANPKQ